ncbi:hypothetical protein [Rhodanobacter sp. L36]|uniref:hypothetical protein n=1 Tax=Rhodanobacter sp. L36 TaxID=1747221 RepID=UPI00131D8CE0|nr:hypothetical protein [Rhodanobacter sp. L36]
MHRSFKPRMMGIAQAAAIMAVALLAVLPVRGHASTRPEIPVTTLGAHTLLVQIDHEGVSPAVTSRIDTQASGSSLLTLVAGFASNSAAPADTYGNTWKQIGDAAVYNGYDGRFNAKAYVALAGHGGPRHTVTLVKGSVPEGEITIPFIEIKNAGKLQDVARNYPTPGLISRAADKLARTWQGKSADPTRMELTSGSVTTTGPATLVAVWLGDAYVYSMTAVPDDGFKVIDSYLQLPPNSAVQCAVATRQVTTAGTYNVTWKGTPAQGAILWLFAFQSDQPKQ